MAAPPRDLAGVLKQGHGGLGDGRVDEQAWPAAARACPSRSSRTSTLAVGDGRRYRHHISSARYSPRLCPQIIPAHEFLRFLLVLLPFLE